MSSKEGTYQCANTNGESGNGRPNYKHFYGRIKKEVRDTIAKIEDLRQLTPHSCRHTYVSQMQALGVDLSTIQSIVGHADVDMTQHYLHVQ